MERDRLNQLLGLLKPYYGQIIIIICFMFASTGCAFIIPLIERDLIDKGLIRSDLHIIIHYSVIFFILFFAYQIIQFVSELLRTNVKAKLCFSLHSKAFNHICKIKLENLNKNPTELYNTLETDITNISMITDNNTIFAFTQILNILAGFLGLATINWKLGLLVLLFMPIKYFITNFLAKLKKKTVNLTLECNEKYAQWINSFVLGIKEIRLFDLILKEQCEFAQLKKKNLKLNRKMELFTLGDTVINHLLFQSLISLLYIIGGLLITKQRLSVGGILAFMSYLSYVTTPISAILSIKLVLSNIFPSLNRYIKFLKSEEEYDGYPTNKIQQVSSPVIDFKDVSFTYKNSLKEAISHISFSINQGEKVAIIGNNGAGKSTLLQLLFRFADTKSGSIEMFGSRIDAYPIQEYRNNFAVVDQTVYLFDNSIAFNITLSNKIDVKRLEQVLIDSHMHEMVSEKSLDYELNQNGKNLSGGQKQKIALARAIYSNRNILVFDEVTANLDVTTKISFCSLLKTSLKDKTVIIITHSNDILQHVDKVIEISSGKISRIYSNDSI